MSEDGPIIDEVRERRLRISRAFDDDLERFGQHLLEIQKAHRDRLVGQVSVVAQGASQDPPPSERSG